MIFIKNKYTGIYYKIIERAKLRNIVGYVEKHHIIPRSLGGTNKKDNIVSLTAREHFICHWLLTKMVNSTKHKYQMWNAFSCMLYRENNNQSRYKISSRTFENIKRNNSHLKSILWSGESNPMYGKTHTDDSKQKISNTHKGREKSIEERKAISQALSEKPKSKKHKQSLKNAWKKNKANRSGKNSSWYGRSHSEESKEKIRQRMLTSPKISCPYCGLESTPGNIKRWHGDNCKIK